MRLLVKILISSELRQFRIFFSNIVLPSFAGSVSERRLLDKCAKKSHIFVPNLSPILLKNPLFFVFFCRLYAFVNLSLIHIFPIIYATLSATVSRNTAERLSSSRSSRKLPCLHAFRASRYSVKLSSAPFSAALIIASFRLSFLSSSPKTPSNEMCIRDRDTNRPLSHLKKQCHFSRFRVCFVDIFYLFLRHAS